MLPFQLNDEGEKAPLNVYRFTTERSRLVKRSLWRNFARKD